MWAVENKQLFFNNCLYLRMNKLNCSVKETWNWRRWAAKSARLGKVHRSSLFPFVNNNKDRNQNQYQNKNTTSYRVTDDAMNVIRWPESVIIIRNQDAGMNHWASVGVIVRKCFVMNTAVISFQCQGATGICHHQHCILTQVSNEQRKRGAINVKYGLNGSDIEKVDVCDSEKFVNQVSRIFCDRTNGEHGSPWEDSVETIIKKAGLLCVTKHLVTMMTCGCCDLCRCLYHVESVICVQQWQRGHIVQCGACGWWVTHKIEGE